MSSNEWWGLEPPEDAIVAWGARTIFSPREGSRGFGLVWDRQAWAGSKEDQRELSTWLNSRGLDAIAHLVRHYGLRPDETRAAIDEVDGYWIEANPRSSYGYLYLVAYRLPGWDEPRGSYDIEHGIPGRVQ